jgi:ABC-type spermidine/putrescine transport system permease subunit II
MQNEITIVFNVILLVLLSAIVYYGVSLLVMLRKGETAKMWTHALIGSLILVVGIITLSVGIFEGSISNLLGNAARDIGAVMVFSGSLVGMLGSKERLGKANTSEKQSPSDTSNIFED